MQLQSKIYEPTTTYTLVIFLNVVSQLDAHYGINPELQELSVCAAASVADWALDQGFAVGLYANTIMYMPEVGLSADEGWGETEQQNEPHEAREAEQPEGQSNLRAVLQEHLKRRRIHLPPASNEEQRKRIMEVLARVQSYFGSTIEDVIQTERTRLPAGATVVVITSTLGEFLLDSLTRVRQSGHAITILYVGDTPLPTKLAGATVYHIGGEETWKELLAANLAPSDHLEPANSSPSIHRESKPSRSVAGFQF
jgi:hypothetical protein